MLNIILQLIKWYSHTRSCLFISDPACQEINIQLKCYVSDPTCKLKGPSEEQYDVGKIIGLLIAILILIIICVAIKCFQNTCRKGMYTKQIITYEKTPHLSGV